jgi:hypothetical protein
MRTKTRTNVRRSSFAGEEALVIRDELAVDAVEVGAVGMAAAALRSRHRLHHKPLRLPQRSQIRWTVWLQACPH